MNKRKILIGGMSFIAGYMAIGHIVKKIEEIETNKNLNEITKAWEYEKKSEALAFKGNVLVIGDDENEKKNFIISHLLREECSAVVNDPTGDIYKKTEQVLKNKGYHICIINLSEVNIFHEDSVHLSDFSHLSDEKTVLYLTGISSAKENIPESCFLSLFYDQLFEVVKKTDGHYPIHFYLGEFSEQPMLPALFSRLHEKNISILFSIENIKQIEDAYADKYTSILDFCTSILFLGGTEPETLHYLYKRFASESPYYVSQKNCILFTDGAHPCVFSKKRLFQEKEG